MISSRRSTAPSYVIASAAMSCLLLGVDYLGADAAVGQPDVEAPGLARRRGCGQRLAVVVQEQCVAPFEGALGVVRAQGWGAGGGRFCPALLEGTARAPERRDGAREPLLSLPGVARRAIDRAAPRGDSHPPADHGPQRGLAASPDHARGDPALELVPDRAPTRRGGTHLARELVEANAVALELVARGPRLRAQGA